MEMLGASPFIWLKFDKNGSINPTTAAALSALLNKPDVADLVVMSHGWKNDEGEARALYQTLWANTCDAMSADRPAKIVVAGVLWPSKTYGADFDQDALIASAGNGAMAVAVGAAGRKDIDEQVFEAAIKEFLDVTEGNSSIALLANALGEEFDAARAQTLVKAANSTVGLNTTDGELAGQAIDLKRAELTPDDALTVLLSLQEPPSFQVSSSVGSAQGLGETISNLFAGPKAAVARYLNLLTYYEMKKRAGLIGQELTAHVLAKLTPERSIRCHLVGHSFGARLVTSAANEMADSPKVAFRSLTLLQGAFSQNAFARNFPPGVSGAFLNVVGKPKGPIAITHTHNDLACTLAYAIASRLSRDMAQAVGDKDDVYGAMGANGPQHLEPGQAVEDDVTQTFSPIAGKVNTFLADKFVVKTKDVDAHNNVTNKECGRLLARVIS